jgi:streptomycin 6-kinase
MQLNPNFISNIQDLYGKAGLTWIKDLPAHITQLCEKHGLRFLNPMSNLMYHFVGLVEIIPSGEKAAIKIAPINQNISHEAKWLQCFNKGVPKIYWYDEAYHAYLMECLTPGEPLKLKVGVDDDLATRTISQIILDLQANQKIQYEFKHLSELEKSYAVLKGRIDNKLLSQATSWFQEMTADRTQDVLLHGDLHHDNILSHGLVWKAIDPHGYIGDPVFEVGPMIYNPGGEYFPKNRPIAQTIERRLKILAESLPFDAQRIKAWAFCMTVLSIAWTVEDHAYVPEFQLMIADVIDKIQI